MSSRAAPSAVAEAFQSEAFFEQSLLPMAVVTLDGAMVSVNEALGSLVGRAPEMLVGSSVANLCRNPADEAAVAAMLSAARDGARAGQAACEISTADAPVPVQLTWTSCCDSHGEPGRVALVFVVMTERAEGPRARAESEAPWRTLLTSAADSTWTLDAEGVVLSVTFGEQIRGGRSAAELIGRSSYEFVHAADLPAVRTAWSRVTVGGERRMAVECRIRTADDDWRWHRLTVTDMRDDPAIGALVGTSVDITEQQLQNAALARRTAEFRARFEQSKLAQAMLDLDGRLSAVNPAFCELVDKSSGELLHTEISSLRHPDDTTPAGDGRLTRVLGGDQDHAQYERLLVGPAGVGVPVCVDVTVMRDALGSTFGAAVFLHDLTAVQVSERRRQQQEAYFSALNRMAGDLALVGDADGQLVYVSPAVERILGHTQQELLGSRSWDFVHPDDRESVKSEYLAVARDEGSRTVVVRVRGGDGAWRWMEETTTNRLADGIGGVVCNLRDVTERVEADRALRESEARYRTIADTADEGIWAVTPTGQTMYANARMAAILGVPLQRLYDQPAASFLGSADAARMSDRLTSRAERGPERYELGVRNAAGDERWLLIAASPLPGPDGTLVGSLAMVSDVTEARHVEQELRRVALHDALTGLPNRALFLDRLQHALTREAPSTAVMIVDLDHFKLVNDSRGHAVGDELLVSVGERLRATVRPHDTLGRFGGDEFVVLVEDTDEADARRRAESLLDALTGSVMVDGALVHIGASVGIALSPPSSAVDLLRFADTAMYSAKAAGRGRVRLFDPALADEAEARYVVGADLRVALAENVLTLDYQPIVDLTSGAVLGMEALARWTHPQLGPVPPTRFVGIAEASGLAPDLDRWALSRGLHEAQVLRRRGATPPHAYVSINLSASNVSDGRLEDFIVSTTDSAGMPPSDVVLEITEGAIMRDADLAIPLLRRLRARGFRLAIDDFGTGHSSLAYLRDLPISILKIDRSFVTGIREDSDALAVVASILDLARAVGMTVVAEGVEEAEQAALLRDMGCESAQGWLWSAAKPPHEILTGGQWMKGYDVGQVPQPSVSGRRAARPRVQAEHGLDRILTMHRKGASLATIAAALNSDGYLRPNGLRWHSTSVARAVADEAYPDLTNPS